MADKKRKKNSPDKDSRTSASEKNSQPILPLLILTLAALSVLGVAAVFLHPPTRNKAVAVMSKTRHIIDIIKDDGKQTPGTDDAARNVGVSDAALRFQNALVAKFTELELRDADYSIQYFPRDSAIEIKAAVPRGHPMEWVIWNLSSAPTAPYRVDDCVCATETNCAITFNSSNAKQPKAVVKIQQSNRYMSNTAKIAVLIENFGFEADATTAEYLSFPEPLTVALLPAGKLAVWTAQIADEYKKEVVLLLPMEPLPQQYDKYKNSMVMIHYSDDNIRNIISQAATAIPNFSGVCNFHGAKVMEDSRVMGIILSEVSKRKAYFVHTDISKKSVTPQLTKSMKIPNAPIQGSIDAAATAEQVKEKLRRYSVTAEKTGKVLIKAQPSTAFIKALKEETEAFKKNGIKLVYVSELVK
ncbi:MAG: divergent polysaccharide deacetylase family protein [Chitinispirillales bacterium]|jgi:polysaccharide deacetylase 2 family uncharacterized protein YibQ|nr:divergent polysaccharide deacetylase family protein [Chitinispirillales bacterium]